MKTTNETWVLLYDEHCPLCSAYSRLFVRLGLLTKAGRLGYDAGINDPQLHFDQELAKNRIALIDRQTQHVSYGISSLLRLLGSRWKWVEKLGNLPVIHQLLQMLYSFITYNRKLIAPAYCHSMCSPTRNWFWRMVFVLFSAGMTQLAAGSFMTQHLSTWYNPQMPFAEVAAFGFQVLVLLFFHRAWKQSNAYEYLGTLAFVSLIGAVAIGILNLILLLVQSLGIHTELIASAGFGMILLIMFLIHQRRIAHYGWSKSLSFVWILLRLALYPLLFQL